MDDHLYELLNTIDFYYDILESPEVFKKVNSEYLKKTFQTCSYIENAIIKIVEEKKEIILDTHIKAWMSRKKKKIHYKCSDLKYACDKILELCLKEKEISNELIDELLKMYIQQCGTVRFEANINCILKSSMQANTILEIFKNLEFPKSDIDDEMLIISWDQEIKIGRPTKVMEYLTNMFNEEYISRLIELAHKSKRKSPVNILILNLFSKKLISNNLLLYSKLNNTKEKVLLKLLADNVDFQISFIDATFYFGRSLEFDDINGWITKTDFSYTDLKKTMKTLLNGPNDLYTSIIHRIKIAKELDEIWNHIERDCIL